MLKERTLKFKEQEAKKLEQSMRAEEVLRAEAKIQIADLEAQLQSARDTAAGLEDEVARLEAESRQRGAAEQAERQGIRESLAEIRRQLKAKKDQLYLEKSRAMELEVANSGLRQDLQHLETATARLRQEQNEKISQLSLEVAEVGALRRRVDTLETLQQGMGDCLQDSQRRAREAEEKASELLARLGQSSARVGRA
ncbi:unnamed protein product [Effrenium voratum]|nr:unnamed protein product [Effrenium voratum]